MTNTEKSAIIIGGEGTQWPLRNAAWVAKAGFRTTILSFSSPPSETEDDSIELLTKTIHFNLMDRLLLASWAGLNIILAILWWPSFRTKTKRNPRIHDLCLIDNPITARKKALIIDQLAPDLIIAHNTALAGLTLSRTRTGKRILIGWGADFTESFYSSPLQRLIYSRIFSRVDLFIQGCESALEDLSKEFAIDQHRILRCAATQKKLNWIMNDRVQNPETLIKLKIPKNKKIIFNARRFSPGFGGMEAFKACLNIAQTRSDLHFVFIEGRNNTRQMNHCNAILNKYPRELSAMFTLVRGERPLSEIIDLLFASKVFLSLRKRGDMRSATVIQGAAAGATPVLPNYIEWEKMKENGFEAFLVDPNDHEALVGTILEALDADREKIAQKNRSYLEMYESDDVYFDRFSDAISKLVDQQL